MIAISAYELPYFTIGVLASFLEVHPLTILALVEKGDIPAPEKVGGHLRFGRKEIAKWLRGRIDG